MDKLGAKAVRVASLAFFIGGTLLFAFASAGDSVVDAYTVAGCLVSLGGGGFFFSHFVIAEHFKGTHFGLVHTIVNGAFDASTVTMSRSRPRTTRGSRYVDVSSASRVWAASTPR